MMPLAMEPAMPSALVSWRASSFNAAPTPAAAAIVPNTAVGWKPALCTALGTTRLRRQMVSTPTAMPRAPAGLELLLLGGGEHGRHDDGAGVHGPALEGVVEVLAVGGRAVDEGAPRGAEALRVADGRGGAGVRPRGQRGLHVVGAARDDAQADDVDQEPLAGLAHCRRQPRRVEGGDAPG